VYYDDDLAGSSSGEGADSGEEDLSHSDAQLAEQIVLATTVFKCQVCSPNWPSNRWNLDDSDEDDDFDDFNPLWGIPCNRPMPLFYPKVMGHDCLTRKVKSFYDGPDPSVSLDQLRRARTGWTCKSLILDKKAKAMMEVIVECCGLDPAFATPKDLDHRDALLGCSLCATWLPSSEEAVVLVFGWRSALEHLCRRHGKAQTSWITLSEEQATLARASGQFPVDDYWSSTHCLDRPCEHKSMHLAVVRQHIISGHGVLEPQLNTDYHAADANKSNLGYLCSEVTISMKRPPKKSFWRDFEDSGFDGFVSDFEGYLDDLM